MKERVVGILGVGSIGGSIGMRARRDGALVYGYDPEPAALAAALELGAIDFAATRDEVYARAGTVVLAAHAAGTIDEIARLRGEGPIRATLVTDVASVKAPVVRAAGDLASFVAGHPMAGTERSGVRAARANMFEGRSWAYVPSGDERLDARARALFLSLGAVPLEVDADEHDRVLAFTSHLPQVLASCYSAQAVGRHGETFDALTGNTARELLRLGESSYTMWRDILRMNAQSVEPELRELARALAAAADAIRDGDAEALRAIFDREATAARSKV